MRTVVVLFTGDLRLHDNPALATACRTADQVVPLFVIDPSLPADANRRRFLLASLLDLRESLRRAGGDLLIRRGDPVAEAVAVARAVEAVGIVMMRDVSRYAVTRQNRLDRACTEHRMELLACDGVTVVPAGRVRPGTGGDHYKVFNPYWRAWQALRKRDILPAPERVVLPPGSTGNDPTPLLKIPRSASLSPSLAPGGETAGLARLRDWAKVSGTYGDQHDDLPGDATSRLSPYLHFGCVSPLTVATTAGLPEPFIRQVCWRDFFHQVLASFPRLTSTAYRAGAIEEWGHDAEALAAWQSGHTGVPVVDAGMRQLAAEGWMHNRARLITAGYLTKTLRLDWRAGAHWYHRWLLDADVANNYGNWQWVAGTGTDTKPYRRFNPVRQAHRFDPDGDYVRRYVPELAGIPGKAVHEPWLLPDAVRRSLGYPPPLALSTP